MDTYYINQRKKERAYSSYNLTNSKFSDITFRYYWKLLTKLLFDILMLKYIEHNVI